MAEIQKIREYFIPDFINDISYFIKFLLFLISKKHYFCLNLYSLLKSQLKNLMKISIVNILVEDQIRQKIPILKI